MALFESREMKKSRRQVAIRMSKKRVQQYVGECRRMGEKYTDMAKRALALDNKPQCDQYLMRRIQYSRQANKWESFLLRMEDLSLRGQMSDAMNGLISGMQALTKEIRAGVSAKDMNKAITELNLTTTQLEQTEEQFTASMDGLDLEIGTPASEDTATEVPAEMREEIESLRSELFDEVVVQEKVGQPPADASVAGGKKKNVDSRINAGMERVRKLKDKSR